MSPSTSTSRVSATPTSTPSRPSGVSDLPGGARSRDRRRRHRGRFRRHQVSRSATASASAVSSTRAASASTAWPARSSTAHDPGMVGTYNGVGTDGQNTQGGYSGAIVVDENYVLSIPDACRSMAAAAPLLCAGITTYSPLRHWNAGPGTTVAVIGLGGLGHLAVKLAACDGRRSHGAQPVAEEDGRRPAARRRATTTPPATATRSPTCRAHST